jgi:initiation factor 1A
MVNTKGGKAYKKQKKSNDNDNKNITLPKDHNQIFAQVTKLYGGKNIGVKCTDDVNRMARIPGRLYKKGGQWMQVNDIVLVLTDETDNTACEIVCKYNPSEVHLLKSMKILNYSFEGYDNNEEVHFMDEETEKYYELENNKNSKNNILDNVKNDNKEFNFDDI